MDKHVHSTNAPTVSIGGVEIAPLAYKGMRVLTTELLSREFGANEDHITTSLARHKARFEDGKHIFRVTGAELRALKNEPTFCGLVGKNASQLLLWPERGAARLAKIIDTDTAWEIYERLEDTYFAVRDGKISVDGLPLPKKLKAVGDVMHGFIRLAGLLGLKGNQRALSAAMATRRETGVDVLQLAGVTHLETDVQDQFLTPTQIASRTDPASSNQKINAALAEMGFQMEHRKKVKGRDRHDYWELTDTGKKAGGDYRDTTKKNRDGTPVLQIKWPTSVIAKVQQHMEQGNTK